MTVTVVIPCRNRAEFLRPTIESALRQSYPNIEVIVVDGASTDNTVEILKSYGDRIRWVSENDNGHADAINKGWKLGKGEILTWLNADDMWKTPNGVQAAVNFLESHPEVDIVYGRAEAVDEVGNVTGFSYSCDWDIRHALLECDHCICQPASFIRRRLVEKLNGIDTRIKVGIDHDFWLRATLNGAKFHKIPDIVAQERSTPGTWNDRGYMTGFGKLQLTDYFFSNPLVPENLKALRRLSYSAAHKKAAQYGWKQGNHFIYFTKQLALATFYQPSNAWGNFITFAKALYQTPQMKWTQPIFRALKG